MNLVNLLTVLIAITLIECVVNGDEDSCANVKNPTGFIRKKRHLTFPQGTVFVMTISLVKAIMTHAPSGWNISIEIDVIFPMLNPEMTNALYRKKIHHRQKREFWEKLQNALDSYNINGRSCTYRCICEAREHLAPPGKSLVHDILRAVFSAPIDEDDFKEEISGTYDDLLEPDFCKRDYDCPLSLLDMILSLSKNND